MSATDPPMPTEQDGAAAPEADIPFASFFDNILAPGSSLNPSFLLVVDASFAFLLVVLIALLAVTRGSIHFIVLIGIELCLWASVKWFVNELKQTAASGETSKPKDE